MTTARTALRPVLLVDDSIDDVFILTRQLQKAGLRHPVQVARDGDEAMRLLAKVKVGSEFPPTAAIITDLNMPGCDGFMVLKWLQVKPWAGSVLTVVASTSDAPRDVKRAYRCGCHAYVVKYPSVAACEVFRAAIEALADGLPLPELPGLRRNYDGVRR